MPKLKEYIGFYKVAKKRANSHQDYIEFESYQSNMVINFLKNKGVKFRDSVVLDVGCGRGGYARKFRKEGAKVIALDITTELFQNVKGIDFTLGNVCRLPFKDNSFDFIFSSSLIEHVPAPNVMVSELGRVLKKDGIFYLSFPPFWSPVGSHQFKPFHYLGERAATALSRKLYGVKSHKYDDKWGKLYIRKISQVKKLLKQNGLNIKSTTTRMSPINFAKIPFLNELFTWHVEFLIKK
jgi:SAM-dependent methyltransferase